MQPDEERETPSSRWIHDVRESQYRATRRLPLHAWLKAADPQKVAQACRQLGLEVKITRQRGRKRIGPVKLSGRGRGTATAR